MGGGRLLSFPLVIDYAIVSCFIWFYVCYVCSHIGFVCYIIGVMGGAAVLSISDRLWHSVMFYLVSRLLCVVAQSFCVLFNRSDGRGACCPFHW